MSAAQIKDTLRGLGAARRAAERERWSRAQLDGWQQERLRALAVYATGHSDFWRERLGDRPGEVRLAQLPTLDKFTLMEHFDAAVTDRRLRAGALLAHLERLDHDGLYLDEFRAMTTSGSSGLKGLFVYDRAGWVELMGQFFRYSAWAGTSPKLPRRRIAAIGGAGPTHMTRRVAETVDIGLHKVLSLPVTMAIPEMVEKLNAFRPDWLNVFPSVAGLLADEQEAGRLRLRLGGMSTSSELRSPELAERVRDVFGVRPMNFYAMTEGLWGVECEERAGVHLFEDTVIVENVDADGRPVPAGKPGARLLVTNLFNRVQPLIRFEVSDVLTIDPEPCRCGRTLARVRAIEGRRDDVLELGGATVLPLHFGVLTSDAEVRQFQVLQRGDGVRVRVVLRDGADAETAPARIAGRVAERLAAVGVARPDVDVELCSALERGGGGKLQLVVAERR